MHAFALPFNEKKATKKKQIAEKKNLEIILN